MANTRTDYSVTILESSKELTPKERIGFKDTTNAISLDEAVTEGFPLVISPESWVMLNVHNEKAEDKEYLKYIVVDKSGQKYTTGSGSFWISFQSIWTEMEGENEPYEIEIYKLPSKNFKGKSFLTCSIVM